MQPGKARTISAKALVEAALRGELTKTQGRRLYRLGPEVVTLALWAASRRIAEQDARLAELESKLPGPQPSPSTPSGMVPV